MVGQPQPKSNAALKYLYSFSYKKMALNRAVFLWINVSFYQP